MAKETKSDKQVVINITTGTMVRALIVLLLFYIAYLVRDTILILITSIVLASAIEPFVRGLGKIKLPRAVSALVVYVVAAGILFGLSIFFVPPMLSEISVLAETLPQYLSSLDFAKLLPPQISQGTLVGDNLVNAASLQDAVVQIKDALAGLSQGIFQTATRVFGGALSAILILVISFYFVVQEKGAENFIRVVAPLKHEKYVIGLWKRTRDKIGLWLQGQLLLGVIIGVLVYLGLAILKVDFAVSLAVLAGVMELIPIFGPIIAAVPAVIIAFSDSASLGLMVVGLYFIIQQFENQLIYPLVVTKIVGIPPIIVIVSLIVGGSLAGFLGFLLAVPIATVIVEIFNDVEKEKMALYAKRSHDMAK